MGMFDLFHSCVACGKNGLFANLDDQQYCPSCAKKRDARIKVEMERKAAQQRIEETLHPKRNTIQNPKSESDLDHVPDRTTWRVSKIDNAIQLYSYIKVPVGDVDRKALYNMYVSKEFKVVPKLGENGSVILISELLNAPVAKLTERISMCTDWIERNDPIRCEFTGFVPGKEHVALAFYRDEEAKLRNHESVIVKLTACLSEEKQDGIQNLESGEKLTCSEDDVTDGKVNVLDYCEEPIGRLPKKYADMFLSEGFSGVFFDHAEENDNGKLIPYVKIYLK